MKNEAGTLIAKDLETINSWLTDIRSTHADNTSTNIATPQHQYHSYQRIPTVNQSDVNDEENTEPSSLFDALKLWNR